MFKLLRREIREWLKEMGYDRETEIQEKAIPKVLEGKDLLIIAPTGHGKTLAAVLPLFNKLSNEGKGIKMLYICPLRALNRDILRRIADLGSRLWIEVDIRHGDTERSVRAMQAKLPPDVLITTPETLQAILVGKRMREHLKNVRVVVVDEIHELVNSKRGSQLSIALQRLRLLAGDFQIIGLSATIGNKEEVAKFLSEKCEIVESKAERKYDVKVELVKPDTELAEVLFVSGRIAGALKRMEELVKGHAIIFTNTREAAELVGSKLKQLMEGVETHHSSLSKERRVEAERRLKLGEINAIVATSSLELGIDVGVIDLVIQFSSPRQVTKLVQRVGRSGHGVGRIARGVVLTLNEEDYLESLSIVKRLKKGWLEPPTIFKKPYDVLAHQIVGFCMDFGPVEKDFIFENVRKCYPYRDLKREEFERVVDFLRDIGLVRIDGKVIRRTRKGLYYYFENLSVIPDEVNYVVIDGEKNRKVGILHQEFVVQHVGIGSKFVMSGEVWRVVDVEGRKIKVIRDKDVFGAIPSWEGELIPVPFEIAQDVAQEKGEGRDVVWVERKGDVLVLYCPFGSKVNLALAQAMGAMLSQRIGRTVGVKSDPYRVVLMGKGVKEKDVKELLKERGWIREVLKLSLPKSSLFHYRFWHVAQRFGVIRREAEVNLSRVRKLVDLMKGTPLWEEVFNEIFTEKMDVEGAERVLGEIKVRERGWSERSENFLTLSGYVRMSDERELIDVVEKRLKSKKFKYVCTHCWYVLGTFPYGRFPKKCPKCGSKLLGVSVEKQEVNKEFYRKTAPLYLYYGKDACLALAGYGIGPQTALRILSRYHKDEKDLIRDIIEEERRFLRTRRFWD